MIKKVGIKYMSVKVKLEPAVFYTLEQFKAFTDLVPGIVWTADSYGTIEYTNKNWYNFTGLKKTPNLEKSFFSVIHPDDQKRAISAWNYSRKHGSFFEVEIRLSKYDGTYHWFLMRGKPIRSDHHAVWKWFGIATDITDRIALEDQISSQYVELENIYRITPIGLALIDSNYQIIRINDYFADMLDMRAKKLIGKPLFQQAPLFAQPVDKFIQKVFKTGKPVLNVELAELDNANNHQKKVWKMNWHPLKDEDKAVVAISMVAEDITEKKYAENNIRMSEERLATIYEKAPIGIVEIAADGRFIAVNEEYCRITGYKKNQLLHLSIKDNSHPEDYPIDLHHLQQLIQGVIPFYRLEKRIVRPDGTSIWTELMRTIAHHNPGDPIRILSVIVDISERKKLEQRKDDFFSMASHELKTPFTTIKAISQILQRNENISPSQRKIYLKKMNLQIDRINDLISNLLDISKMEKGKIAFIKEKFNFDNLVKETRETIQQITKSHKIYLRGKTHKKVYADRERISQVIINLINNAVKYSPKADKVIIKSLVNTHEVQLSVRDFGIGIPKRDQINIFDRFYRVVESTDKTYPGLGVGLYISQQIIKRHGGEIKVNSRPGKGSTFTFTLPLAVEKQNSTSKYLILR